MNSTNFGAVATWNYIAGVEPKANPTLEDPLAYELIKEEVAEYLAALHEGNIREAAEELSDLLFVVYGAFYRMGLNADRCFSEVIRSNFSKFCDNEEDAIAAVEHYNEENNSTTYARYDKVKDIYVIRRNSDDKVLKSIKYSPKDFSALEETNAKGNKPDTP